MPLHTINKYITVLLLVTITCNFVSSLNHSTSRTQMDVNGLEHPLSLDSEQHSAVRRYVNIHNTQLTIHKNLNNFRKERGMGVELVPFYSSH